MASIEKGNSLAIFLLGIPIPVWKAGRSHPSFAYFIVVLETARMDDDGVYHLSFPRSGLIMLRHTAATKDQEVVRLHFADGDTKDIILQVLKAQAYSIDDIFSKKLYFLIPFYIMRFENVKHFKGQHRALVKGQMLSEMEEILNRLHSACLKEGTEDVYADIRDMTEKIADFVFQNSKLRKEVTDMIKRKIYDLPSDKIKAARDEGKAETENEMELVAHYMKENRDDSFISNALKLPIEKIERYRSILSIVL